MALALSGAYLGWTLVANTSLERDIRAQYASRGVAELELLTVPTPFNSLAWRILVMGSDGYAEGFYSYVAPGERMELKVHPSSRAAPAELRDSEALRQLRAFSRGFYAIEERAGRVVFTDLRMGMEPDYVFRFELAQRKDGTLQVLDPPEQLPWPRYSRAQLARVWQLVRGKER